MNQTASHCMELYTHVLTALERSVGTMKILLFYPQWALTSSYVATPDQSAPF
jgi:hypothetical protein